MSYYRRRSRYLSERGFATWSFPSYRRWCNPLQEGSVVIVKRTGKPGVVRGVRGGRTVVVESDGRSFECFNREVVSTGKRWVTVRVPCDRAD